MNNDKLDTFTCFVLGTFFCYCILSSQNVETAAISNINNWLAEAFDCNDGCGFDIHSKKLNI